MIGFSNSTQEIMFKTNNDQTNRKTGQVQQQAPKKKNSKRKRKRSEKVLGKGPLVRVPYHCRSTFFRLNQRLGHENEGETIAWLLKQSEHAVCAVLGTNLLWRKPTTKCEQNNSPFNDLDGFNVKKNFGLNQIWALWHDVDGMPRLYARIHQVFPAELKVEVALLEPQPTTNEETQWFVEKHLPVACGTFKEAKLTTTTDVSAFSHQVNCRRPSRKRSCYNIFPRKGEIWAVFKDWDISWTLHDLMSDTQYEMVEVLSDICEATGSFVIGLTRLGEHEDVFERQLHEGHVLSKQFSGKELLRFSHRVPASKVTGEGIPTGSWKLNSAALPHQLL
ncbi:Dnaj heat shock n-terminal domain-containing protein [Thalictrum thalictroides]|uniref:Dnaj heat shock n-terminal domain-containing protein n=1 Tax=Thalictrum thalictroides TaxID=46969 RepID=A0A7J6WTJ1_THATH|nr:Dnaj heat shock n-terminal domain-containing protein [Thalictrum thalictroides]